MSFNNRNFNPNIWDTPRAMNPPPFINNQNNQNFPFVGGNFQQQNRPNFFQNNQMRPQNGPFNDERQNFRKFNNPPDFRNNNNNNNIQRGGGRNFLNVPPPKWKDQSRTNETQQRDSFENTSPVASTNEGNRSIVEQLRIKAAKINSKQQQAESPSNSDNIDAFAKTASKKLLNEIRTDKGNIKDMINNPKQPHMKAAITYHAREKLRRGMQKQLKTLGGAEDDADFFDAQDTVELKDIPQTLIAQMGHELGVDDMDLSNFEEAVVEDKEMAVVENNLGNDFLFGSEQLLMNGFSLLGENESEQDLPPPLPLEPVIKPPEPVPPPLHEATYSSENVPWSPAKPPPQPNASNQKFYENDDWEFNAGKNPDPPSNPTSHPIPVLTTSNRSRSETPANDDLSKVKVEPAMTDPSTPLRDENPSNGKETSSSNGQQFTPIMATPKPDFGKQDPQNQQQPPQIPKVVETYGDYKRRNKPPPNNNNFNKPRPLNQQQNRGAPVRFNDWDADDNSTPRSASSSNNDNWMNNNRRNNNDRKSRQDQQRSRDDFRKRSNSRDRWSNASSERQQSSDLPDGFNYRFDGTKDNKSNLNAILQPKTQFKGSFNKNRMGPRDFMNRSREKTPTNNEGEFGDFATVRSSSKDARPCSIMLKRLIEMDTEMMSIHDKIHGIDKVIQNLQSERVTHQKKISQIQHDRKIIFDNLLKRSQYNEATERAEHNNNNNNSREKSPPGTQKASANKKLQNMVDQKKRKNEPEPIAIASVEEPPKKKKFIPIEEPKSAAQRQKEKDEKELKERLEKIRKQKALRREKEEAERRKLEEEALKASKETIIKLEKVSNKPDKIKIEKTEKVSKITFNSNEFIRVSEYQVKTPKIALIKVPLAQTLVDQYKSARFPQILSDEWNKWSGCPLESRVPSPTVQIINETTEKDPLALDDQPLTQPPTPGNHLTNLEHDENSSDETIALNYDEWAGNFEGHDSPIVFLQNIDGVHMVCAAEDGKLIKYRLRDGKVENTFSQHSQICNAFLYDQKENLIYTASSDGFVYKIKFKSFQSNGSRNFNESLQVIEKLKSTIYVGAKSGNIYKVKSDLTNEEGEISNEPLCCVEGLILCLKASKEGARSIILVASRGKAIQVRDASDGLLLRTLGNELANVSVYDMALDGSTIYCGCNLNDIFAIDFTNGALIKKKKMLGAGAICVKIYNQFLIAACYDGNIYIFNNNSEEEGAVNITGPSNMLLAMDLWDNKMIASTKDKTVKIMNIPT